MMTRTVQLPTRAKLVNAEEAERLEALRRRAKASMPIGTFLVDRFQERLPGAKRRPMAGYAR